ncbi:carbohydrate ABC transporter permease [Nakamurella aerolata]|uniref:carbohydrate ABC transporter permease n=1 Tax=Nakamurella aerolata TaxID=1656892 RepID=UPI001BB14B2D
MTTTLQAPPPKTAGAAEAPAAPRRPERTHWLLLSPGLLIITALTVVPIVVLVLSSFTDYNRRSLFTGRFELVGVGQYQRLLGNEEFWWSLLRTLGFTAALVVGSIAIGLALTVLLTRLGVALRMPVTVALICAWAMPTVASSVVWNWLFQPGYGVVNWLLTQLGIFGDMANTDWSNDAVLAYVSIWLLIVWQAVPFIALTLYAAVMQVPLERQEAARMDGASEWRVWRSVVIPALRPTLGLVTILSIIWDFNVFNQIWLVSGGGPDSATTTLGVFAFTTAFVGFQIGTGSALSVITTLILLALTALYIRRLLRAGEDL